MTSAIDNAIVLTVAEQAARAAGAELMARYRQPLESLTAKHLPADLVSEADRAAERAVRVMIGVALPDDAILGEEQGLTEGTSGRRWVVDPLDATANYVRHLPGWAVSILCEDSDGDVAAAVYDPLADELFSASRDTGVLINGIPAPTAPHPVTSLAQAMVGGVAHDLQPTRAARVDRARAAAGQQRNFGSTALLCAWAAVGRVDLVFCELEHLEEWDIAAGRMLCRRGGLRAECLPAAADGRWERFVAAPEQLWHSWLELV